MPKQQLDGAQIGAGLKEMDGKGVAQRVRRDRLDEVRPVRTVRQASSTAEAVIG